MATQPRKRKPGGGRKPKAYTVLKRRLEAEKIEDAERAFALYVAVMDNPSEPTALRLAAADWIACRVLGKPKERINLDDGSVKIVVEYAKDAQGNASNVAPSPATDKA